MGVFFRGEWDGMGWSVVLVDRLVTYHVFHVDAMRGESNSSCSC